jgi:hypothetical protein
MWRPRTARDLCCVAVGTSTKVFGLLKWQARQLAELRAVERVTAHDAVVFAPPDSDIKDGSAPPPAVCFDVAVLARPARRRRPARCAPPRLAGSHRGAGREGARCTRSPRGTCVASATWTRPAPACSYSTISRERPGRGRRGAGYPAGRYQAETGLDNSTLLKAPEGEYSDYVLINHARWDGNLALFMARPLPEKTFRSYVLVNLKANRMAATPVLLPPRLAGPAQPDPPPAGRWARQVPGRRLQ